MRRTLFASPQDRNFALVSIIPAVIVAIWTYYIASSPIALVLASLAGLVSFIVCRLLVIDVRPCKDQPETELSGRFPTLDLAILFLYALAPAVIILTKPDSVSLQSDWLAIPAQGWIRFVFSVLIIMFLPGYAILRIVDAHRNLRGLLTVPVSFLLSLGFTVLMAMPFGGLTIPLGWLEALNLVPMSLLAFRVLAPRLLHGGKEDRFLLRDAWRQLKTPESLAVCSALCFVTALVVAVYFVNPWFRGDIWRHFADASFVMRYGLANRGYFYPWFNAVLWAQVLGINGIPGLNAVLIIVSLLYPISIIAFFCAAMSLTKSPVLSGLSTVLWGTFAGLDWLATSSYQNVGGLQATGLVFESGIYYQPGFFGYDHPPFLVGIICLLVLIALFDRSEQPLKTRVPIVAGVFFVGYMIDVEVMVIFLVGFLPFYALRQAKGRSAVFLGEVLGLLIGLAMVAIADLASPSSVKYYLDYTYLPLWSIGVSSLAILVVMAQRLNIRINNSRLRNSPLPKPGLKLAILYLYGLSFAILLLTLPYLPKRPFFENIPAYQYPFRLGIIGALVFSLPLVPASARYLSLKGGSLRPATWILMGLLIEAEIVGWLGVFEQTRFFYPAFVIFSILGAAGLLRASARIISDRQIRRVSTRTLAVAGLVSLVMVSGISSTLLSVNMWSKASGPWSEPITPTEEERAGITYLQSLNIPTPYTVATTTANWASYDNQLVALSGARTLYDGQLNLLFGTRDPAAAFRTIELEGVAYIWESLSRVEPAFTTSYILQVLLPDLQPVFQDSDIRIYKVPPFHSPSAGGVSITIQGDFLSKEEYYIPESVGLSGINYELLRADDFSNSQYQTAIFTSDSPSSGWVDSNFTQWYAGSGSVTRGYDYVTYWTRTGTNPYYDYTSPLLQINVSQQPYLSITWRMPTTPRQLGGLGLLIHGTITGFHALDLGYSDNWTSSFFDLRDFRSNGTELSGWIPIQHDMIRSDETIDSVVFRTYEQGAFYQLKAMGIANNPFNPFSSATVLASNGKNVVVVNSYGYGSIARLMGFQFAQQDSPIDAFAGSGKTFMMPKLELTFHGEAVNAQAVSYYLSQGERVSPLAYTMRWGKGEITYVDLKPFLDALVLEPQGQDRSLSFSALGNIPLLVGLNESNTNTPPSSTIPPLGFAEPIGGITFRSASFQGDVLLNSSFLEQANESRADSITVDSVPINGIPGGSFLRNIDVNGSGEILLSVNWLYLFPSPLRDGYSVARIRGASLLTIETSSIISIEIGADINGSSDIRITGNKISIAYSQPVDFLVRSPLIDIQGASHFVNAWSDELSGRTVLSRLSNITFSGESSLLIDSGSQGVESGALQIGQQTSVSGNSVGTPYTTLELYTRIPWAQVFFSGWQLGFLGFLGLFYIGYSTISKRDTRARHSASILAKSVNDKLEGQND